MLACCTVENIPNRLTRKLIIESSYKFFSIPLCCPWAKHAVLAICSCTYRPNSHIGYHVQGTNDRGNTPSEGLIGLSNEIMSHRSSEPGGQQGRALNKLLAHVCKCILSGQFRCRVTRLERTELGQVRVSQRGICDSPR